MMTAFYSRYRTGKKQLVSLPQTITPSQICIFPTPFGILFILIILSFIIGSAYYINNLGFFITFLLGSMVLVSLFHSYRNLLGIQILSVQCKPVFAGEKALFTFLVHVPDALRAGIVFRFEEGHHIVQDLRPERHHKITVPAIAQTRGLFTPGPLLITTRYPFGLFTARLRLPVEVTCTVYPRPIEGLLRLNEAPSFNDWRGKNKSAGADDFHGLRVYLPGDPLQRISWKTLSRGHGLFTKMFVGQAGSTVFLDWDTYKAVNVEQRLSLLCHNILTLHRQNIRYGLKLPGKTIRDNKGEAHKHRCLKALAMV